MKELKQDNLGFGFVGLLAILVVVALVGMSGWLVYQHQNHSIQPTNSADSGLFQENVAQKSVDPTANWTKYNSISGHYSLQYPTTWVTNSCASDFILLLGPTKATVGECASGNLGEMYFLSADTSHASAYNLNIDNSATYGGVTKTPLTLNGVTGTKLTATYKSTGQTMPPYPDNTKIVFYVFTTASRTYIASYYQKPGYPYVLDDFNLIVTKTLKFTS